jgi:hypothetical protein
MVAPVGKGRIFSFIGALAFHLKHIALPSSWFEYSDPLRLFNFADPFSGLSLNHEAVLNY